MNRPNIEDYKLVNGGYSQKYITDLEKQYIILSGIKLEKE